MLEHLQDRLGMRLWLVTRAAGEHQVVLEARDAPQGYGIAPGSVLSWGGSLCAAMVAGDGPHVAPRVADVPAFAAAPNRRTATIEAYVGVPLLRPDGEVFGTLCGFDPEPQDDRLDDAEDLVLLQARLLSTLLHLELSNEELHRRAERAETVASTDVLTGLGNRRGWQAVLEAEETRCQRYGHPASVLVIDLDDLKVLNDSQGHAAGDDLLRTAATVLRRTLEEQRLRRPGGRRRVRGARRGDRAPRRGDGGGAPPSGARARRDRRGGGRRVPCSGRLARRRLARGRRRHVPPQGRPARVTRRDPRPVA